MKASILQNTNRLVSSSESSWGSVRENSLVRFISDGSYYTVGAVSNFLYIKEFVTISGNVVKITGDSNIDLAIGEVVNLSYKEYEIFTLDCLEEGRGYRISDIVTVEDGAIKDTMSGQVLSAKFIVSSVGDQGEVKQLRMEFGGRFIVAPDKEAVLKGGSGSGCKVNLQIRNIDNRSLIEKTITNIEKNSSGVIISFDSLLPVGVSSGKISVDKWQILLTSNYVGPSRLSEDIEFIKDFSPFLKIPLIAKNNKNPEIVYNAALLEIDKRMKKLFDEIESLKAARS